MDSHNNKWNICRSICIFRWKVAFHQTKKALVLGKIADTKTELRPHRRRASVVLVCLWECVCVIFTFPLLTKISACSQPSTLNSIPSIYTHKHTHTYTEEAVEQHNGVKPEQILWICICKQTKYIIITYKRNVYLVFVCGQIIYVYNLYWEILMYCPRQRSHHLWQNRFRRKCSRKENETCTM